MCGWVGEAAEAGWRGGEDRLFGWAGCLVFLELSVMAAPRVRWRGACSIVPGGGCVDLVGGRRV